MNILGLNTFFGYMKDGPAHDPSAALIKDGRLVAAVEEERFAGIKHAHGMIPRGAINYCFKAGGISWGDIDVVAFGWNPLHGLKMFPHQLVQHPDYYLHKPRSLFVGYYWLKLHLLMERAFRRITGYRGEIKFIDHHLAHACSAYYCSPFRKAKILTLDGGGEGNAGLLASGEGNKITRIEDITAQNSLGDLYNEFTLYLGFDHGEEGTTMALASCGKPSLELREFIKIGKDYFKSVGRLEWRRKLRLFDGYSREDIAASLQKKLEEAELALLNRLNEKVSSENLCIAGGVGLNCISNGKLLQHPSVSDIFIQPASGDSGVSLGAALHVLGKHIDFEHAYWGPEYSREEIEAVLKESKLEYEETSVDEVAKLLSEGYIIGWFQGRMEWGPRALGNRSILADPRNAEMKDRINFWVKHRESFRPFAASLLEEAKEEYLMDAHSSPFMILGFYVQEEKRKEIPAVVHVDGTVRPQTVTKRANPKYYELIKSFEEITSVPVVLNTSFNNKGQPMIRDPRTALGTFASTGLDYLAIGDFLVRK